MPNIDDDIRKAGSSWEQYVAGIAVDELVDAVDKVLEHAVAFQMPTPNDPPSQPASKKLSLRASKKKRSP